jgi:hypothetical protein
MSLTGTLAPISSREVIGASSHRGAVAAWATRSPPVTRSARFPSPDRHTPTPKAISNTVNTGTVAVRRALVGAAVADSSLMACDMRL